MSIIRLPQIPTSTIGAPTVNPNALAAPAQALGGLARSIAGVGEHFHEVAVETQKAENGRILSQRRQELAAAYSDFQIKLDSDTDPESRIQKTRDFLSSQKGKLDTEDVPPAVRSELLTHFDEFASNAVIRQGADSANLARKRAGLTLQNELNASTQAGNRGAFDTAINTAKDAGLILPEEVDHYNEQFDRSVTSTTLDLAIEQEPKLVLEDVDRPDFLQRMPGFSATDLPHLRSAARASIQRKRSEEIDLLDSALTSGVLTPPDLEATEYATPGDIATFTKALVKVDPPTAEVHGKAWDLLLENRRNFGDPSISDRDYAEKWNDLRSEVIGMVPPPYRGDISQELNYRSPANRSAAKTQPKGYSEAPELKAIGLERITRARAAGMFGKADSDAPPAEREAAYRRTEELRLEVARFIDQNPKADLGQVTEFTDGLIGGDRVKTSARELQNFVPGSAQRLRPLPTIPPLPPKAGSKDKAVADPLQIPGGDGTASDALLPPLQQLENFLK